VAAMDQTFVGQPEHPVMARRLWRGCCGRGLCPARRRRRGRLVLLQGSPKPCQGSLPGSGCLRLGSAAHVPVEWGLAYCCTLRASVRPSASARQVSPYACDSQCADVRPSDGVSRHREPKRAMHFTWLRVASCSTAKPAWECCALHAALSVVSCARLPVLAFLPVLYLVVGREVWSCRVCSSGCGASQAAECAPVTSYASRTFWPDLSACMQGCKCTMVAR